MADHCRATASISNFFESAQRPPYNRWPAQSLASLEILDRFFVLLCRGFGFECAEVVAFTGPGIFLAGVQAVTGFQFTNHRCLCRRTPILPSRVSIFNVFKSTLAGPWVTRPVRTSKQELCQGHWTSNPSKRPSDNGPNRWVQNSWKA